MNTIILIGQLGKEPELKTSKNGRTYLQNSIYEYAGRDEKNDPVYTWRDIVAYGTTAEAIARNGFKRGRLAVTGTEKIVTYTDKNGVEKMRPEISVSKVDIIDWNDEKPEAAKTEEYVPEGFAKIEDDIPF